MRTYEVVVTPDARDDLAEIRDHIAYRLGSPSSARSTLRSIRKGLGTLTAMPGRVRTVDQEPWRSRGVRRLLVGSFYAYYRISEDEGRVYVLNVVHARASQRELPDGGREG